MPESRDYHCDLAVMHWVAKIESTSRRPYRPVAALYALWMIAADPWAEHPTVHVSSSRLSAIASDRPATSRLLGNLEKLGAIRRGHRSQRGLSITLLKPALSELSEKAQQELMNMHPADYRANPKHEKPEPCKLVVLSDHRPKKPKKISAKRISAKLHEMNSSRKSIARALENLARFKPGKLRYSGQGSEAVYFALCWLVRKDATAKEFSLTCLTAYRDPDPPDDLHYMFDDSSTARAEYLERMHSVAKAKIAKAAAQG